MPTFKLKLELPDLRAYDGLTVHVPQQQTDELSRAYQRLADTRGRIAHTAQRIDELTTTESAASAHDPTELEYFLSVKQAAETLVPRLEEQVRTAQAAVAQGKKDAIARAGSELGRQRDEVQREIDALTPALEHARELEERLDTAVKRLTGDPWACVPAIAWPLPAETQVALQNFCSSANLGRGAA